MGFLITPEIVRLAYRLFLDRDSENETVVEEKAAPFGAALLM